MKRIIYLIGIILLMSGAVKAQENVAAQNGPDIEFNKLNHDFGEVAYNENNGKVKCQFEFTNTGNEPLILPTAPKSTCGCTTPSWPKDPVLPGESAVITVEYNSTKIGNISKDITVTTNSKKNPTVKLHISGRVLERPVEAMPEKQSTLGSPANNK